MADDGKNLRPGQQEEPADEVEGHGKNLEATKANLTDETDKDDEVEAHHHKKNA
jgi:hypothetical protein